VFEVISIRIAAVELPALWHRVSSAALWLDGFGGVPFNVNLARLYYRIHKMNLSNTLPDSGRFSSYWPNPF
jgi:hypothetical protein